VKSIFYGFWKTFDIGLIDGLVMIFLSLVFWGLVIYLFVTRVCGVSS
jgi:hypothetical protein